MFKYYLPQGKVLRKILKKVFVTGKFTQCKASHTLQINVFEIADNKNIGKCFSKYEQLFLGQANSSSNPCQILILQFPTTRAPLPSLPSLWYFTLANWNPSSAQFSLDSLSVSLFCPNPFDHAPSRVLDKLNHMPSQANQIFHQAIHRS